MSNTVIAASLSLDSSQATTSVKTFRTQLREAQNDLIAIQEQFGETSDQAIAAAKGVAQLKASIKDAKEVADLFNPEQKFQAFGNAVRASVGGITALTGAMALFGGESKEVQEALLKVQGALALTEGVNTLADAAKDFTRLKTVALDAFAGIKTAIGSTGIGLFVIALGLIVTYWDDIKTAVGLANSEQEKALKTSTEDYNIEKQKLELIQAQNNLLKQQGKSEQEILEINNKQLQIAIEKGIQNLKAQTDIVNTGIASSFAKNAAVLNATGSKTLADYFFDPKKTIKAGDETLAASQIELKKLQDQLAGNQMAITKDTSDFNQKIIDMNHDAAEAGITDQYLLSQIKLKNAYTQQVEQITLEYTNLKQRQELLTAAESKFEAERSALAKANAKKRLDDLRKINFDAYTANIQDQGILAKLQLQYQLDSDIEQANYEIANVKDRNEKIAALQHVYDTKLADMRNKDLIAFQTKYTVSIAAQAASELQIEEDKLNAEADAELEKDQKQKEAVKQGLLLNQEIADNQLDQAGQQAAQQLQQLEDYYQKKLTLVQGNEAAIAALNKEYERQKTEITEQENMQRLQIISGVLGQAADLFSKTTAAGKVLAVAQATIDTYASAVASYKSLAGIPVVGPALGFAAAAVAVAAGLANVKKILSVQVAGSSSSAPGLSGISASASAPLQVTPQVGSTLLPQDQLNQIGNAANPPVRAFVVESDVTDSQERITRLNRAARLGK